MSRICLCRPLIQSNCSTSSGSASSAYASWQPTCWALTSSRPRMTPLRMLALRCSCTRWVAANSGVVEDVADKPLSDLCWEAMWLWRVLTFHAA